MADSAYGKGFAMRMGVLAVLLILVGAGFYFDTSMKTAAQKTIDEKIWPLATKKSDEGRPPTKQEVMDEFGFAPTETKKVDKYEVEKYDFKRVIPFTTGQYVEVAYDDGYLYKIVVNKEFAPGGGEDLMSQIKTIPEEDRKPIASSLDGGGGGAATDDEDKDDGDDKEGDNKDGDKKEEASDDTKKEDAADDKKEEKKDDDSSDKTDK